MNEDLSIGTDTVGETDVLSVSATDADENVVVDVKHLTVDSENVARFREQLKLQKSLKETAFRETLEDAAKKSLKETAFRETLEDAAKSTQPETHEHSSSSETSSEPHKTAVIDTIPFLRTANETIAPVSDPNAAQASKSHAMLIAQQIRDHIIDRVLVSSSNLNAERAVTVQLSPRLLQDTEVQFTQNGTSLDIRLVSQNKDSVQFLQQHQSDLQTYLQGGLKTYRAISVRVPSSQASGELSQPHDGRSRNRFGYQSADEEETT